MSDRTSIRLLTWNNPKLIGNSSYHARAHLVDQKRLGLHELTRAEIDQYTGNIHFDNECGQDFFISAEQVPEFIRFLTNLGREK